MWGPNQQLPLSRQVSQSVECWVSSSVVGVCEWGWVTYFLRELLQLKTVYLEPDWTFLYVCYQSIQCQIYF
jgi:hypothetical protein